MKIQIKRLTLVLAGAALAALAGCGGGGAPANGLTPAAAVSGTASIDSSVPNALQILTIQTPFGITQPGQAISLPSGMAVGDALVVGTDANNHERLLRYEAGQSLLSLDSTAFALVKLALYFAQLPSGVTTLDIYPFIRTSQFYIQLQDAIRIALSNNAISPLTSSEVMDATALVMTDAINAQTTSSPLTILKADIVKSADKLPFYIWNDGVIDKGWLEDDPALTESPLTFKNRTFLAWQLRTEPLGLSGIAIADPIKVTKAQFIGNYAESETTTAIKEPKTKFVLNVEQTSTTQLINAKNALTKSTSAIVSIAFGFLGLKEPDFINGCVAKTVSKIALEDSFASLLANLNKDTFFGYVKSKFTLSFLRDVYKDCQPGATFSISSVPLIGFVATFQQALISARTGTAAFGTIIQMDKYKSNYAIAVEACRYSGTISRCVSRLESPSISLVVGQSITPSIKAYANVKIGEEVAIPLPDTISYLPDNTEIVQVELGKIKAIRAGEARITVRDSVSGSFYIIPVLVTQDRLVSASPSTVTLSLGGTQQVAAVVKDGVGNVINFQPALSWTSGSQSIAIVSSAGLITAVASGSTVIRITEPVTSAYFDLPVTVLPLANFRFEVAQIDPIFGSGTPSCTPQKTFAPDATVAYPLGSSVSYDLCNSPKDAVVRCIGAGCTGGRFFAAVSQSRLIYTQYCLALPALCVSNPTGEQVQNVFGPIVTGNFDGGLGWFGLNNGGWAKAWQSVSAIRPPNPFVMNVVTDFRPNTTVGFGNPVGASRLDVVYKIYDTQLRTYTLLPLIITAP